MRSRFIGIVSLLVISASSASAGLTSIGPFSGTMSETWESFPNYINNGFAPLSDPTSIMGGGASISNPMMFIYEPGVADFGILGGFADVSDGAKAMGVNEGVGDDRNGNGVDDIFVTIDFKNVVCSFGAYWGFYTGPIKLSAYDVSGALIDSVSFGYSGLDGDSDGYADLEWNGWSSNVGIKTIVYSGSFTVIDGLQADSCTTIVPAPGAALLGMIGLAALRRRPA